MRLDKNGDKLGKECKLKKEFGYHNLFFLVLNPGFKISETKKKINFSKILYLDITSATSASQKSEE